MEKSLNVMVGHFRNRALDAGPHTFVAADALVMEVREGAAGPAACTPWSPPASTRRTSGGFLYFRSLTRRTVRAGLT